MKTKPNNFSQKKDSVVTIPSQSKTFYTRGKKISSNAITTTSATTVAMLMFNYKFNQ